MRDSIPGRQVSVVHKACGRTVKGVFLNSSVERKIIFAADNSHGKGNNYVKDPCIRQGYNLDELVYDQEDLILFALSKF